MRGCHTPILWKYKIAIYFALSIYLSIYLFFFFFVIFFTFVLDRYAVDTIDVKKTMRGRMKRIAPKKKKKIRRNYL